MTKKIKISVLDMDFSIYPRQHLNPYHVDELVEAINSGVKMPPIIIDKLTCKVTDGWHRVEAFRKLWGDDALIQAEVVEYGSPSEMFQDSIKLNASHGQRLTTSDEAHCLAKAEEFHLEQSIVATLLNITTERANQIVSDRLALSGKNTIVLKGSTAHMAGRNLTAEQVAYNRHAGGLNQSFYINQVISMLESDSVDWDNVKTVNGLKKLKTLLKSVDGLK
jgi:hypothetical protein